MQVHTIYQQKCRANEEIGILQREMAQYLNYFKEEREGMSTRFIVTHCMYFNALVHGHAFIARTLA